MAKKPVQKKPATPITPIIPIAGAIVKSLVKSGIAKKVARSIVVKALAKPRFNPPKSTPKVTSGVKRRDRPPEPPKRTPPIGRPPFRSGTPKPPKFLPNGKPNPAAKFDQKYDPKSLDFPKLTAAQRNRGRRADGVQGRDVRIEQQVQKIMDNVARQRGNPR